MAEVELNQLNRGLGNDALRLVQSAPEKKK